MGGRTTPPTLFPCWQMARSFVTLPASIVSMTAASRSEQNLASSALSSSLALEIVRLGVC
jgi:hypothetical protein